MGFAVAYNPCERCPYKESGERCAMCELTFRRKEWISVDERLPDKEGVYLVYTYRGHMKMSKYSGWGVDDEASFDDFFVTHWMPIPEPPMMKGGAE